MSYKIGIIGLGYVGLPLAVEMGKAFITVGYDTNQNRINEISGGYDKNLEVTKKELKSSKKINFTSNDRDLSECNIFIITVPTHVYKNNKPDLKPIKDATKTVAKFIKDKSIIIYESTFYPGLTEEVCVPILEKISGMKYLTNDKNSFKGFYCAYSPERVNPGDKKQKLRDIKKIISASSPASLFKVEYIYNKIIDAGTIKARNIRVAEAAKVIENAQRDVNIAFINEMALFLNKLDLQSRDVLEVAETKWNFLPFKPGLVGGHCISVDPFYLIDKANKIGFDLQMTSSARRINNSVAKNIYLQINRILKKKKIIKKSLKILVMGITFKENCPDTRNSKVIDLVNLLNNNGHKVDVIDPYVNERNNRSLSNIRFVSSIKTKVYDVIILAVPHRMFRKYKLPTLKRLAKQKHIIYDIKNFYKSDEVDGIL
tara:strand:- start:40341 stop:41627 length:1287 start_codon:yes stop_codon:yes gene_type:complete